MSTVSFLSPVPPPMALLPEQEAPEAEPFAPPILAPPLEQRLAALDDRLRATKKTLINLNVGQMEYTQNQLEETNRQRLEQLREAAQQAQSSGFWSFLGNIASFVLSTLSIATGIGTANPVVGSCLIAAGILSIVSALLNDNGGWDWVAGKLSGGNEELRVRLGNILPGIVALLLFGINLTCGALSWNHVETRGQILSLLTTLAAVVSGAATIGKSVSQSRVVWSEAEQSRMRTQCHGIQAKVETISREINSQMTGWRRTNGNIGNMLRTSRSTMDQLLQKV